MNDKSDLMVVKFPILKKGAKLWHDRRFTFNYPVKAIIFVPMDSKEEIVLFTSYFGPVQYFIRFIQKRVVILDFHDNYQKQSYRNRCRIAGANGIQNLVVPVKKVDGPKTKTRDIQVDYDTQWQKNHLRSIESAYRSSPFFEYYFDDYDEFFRKKYKYLVDLNTNILKINLKHCNIQIDFSLSKRFVPFSNKDARNYIHPKMDPKIDPYLKSIPYSQVFSERFGFLPNLSILDLIFNMGPESHNFLKKCSDPIDSQN